ncbi:MAG: hypothetical protein LBB48_07610 [Treponema sp.]|nr:hypothetical protein [Treponema sp.]
MEIQEIRRLFSACRLYQKQNVRLKNLIHALLKERLYGFTQDEIFDRKSRKKTAEIKTRFSGSGKDVKNMRAIDHVCPDRNGSKTG